MLNKFRITFLSIFNKPIQDNVFMLQFIVFKENDQLKKKLATEEELRETEMVCKMADRFGDVAVEVSALRHRVAELEVEVRKRDDEVRSRVSKEYEASFKRIVASLLASERMYNQHRFAIIANDF